jgi:hypothetical protein
MFLTLVRRIPQNCRWLTGTCALLVVAWVNMYGKLWCFERFDAHRFTSRAMLGGTLQLRSLVTLTGHDEQVYNGAVYTNWGFGVPLLEAPFHALAGALGVLHGFFPDRAIYFLYVAAAVPIVLATFDRLLVERAPPNTSTEQRQLVSWLAAWLVLNWVLFPFMSTRFAIFEETLAYMTLCQLLALGAYVFALRSWSVGPVVAMGLAAGIGVLVRPIGVVYLGVWGALVALERRATRMAQFAAAAAPFVAFFLYSNWVRSGSILGLGYANSNPGWEYEMPILRFGSACADTPAHVLLASVRLFGAFFFYVWHKSSNPWLSRCHFDMEERDGTGEPYFGAAVLVLLVGLVVGLVRRRERRLALWLPYATMAFLFAVFVRRGEGFAWRYVGDFWPLLVLAAVQYVHTMPADHVKPLDARTASIFFWGGFIALAHFLVPWQWSSGGAYGGGRAEILAASDSAGMAERFRASHAGVDPPLPSKVDCAEASPALSHGVSPEDHLASRLGLLSPSVRNPSTPYNNRLGWREGCRVATFTNVYLGVPRKEGDRYRLRMRTEGMAAPTVKVYLNGSYYTAEKRGDDYEADVLIRYGALTSPIVVATVLWAREADQAGATLLSIELV